MQASSGVQHAPVLPPNRTVISDDLRAAIVRHLAPEELMHHPSAEQRGGVLGLAANTLIHGVLQSARDRCATKSKVQVALQTHCTLSGLSPPACSEAHRPLCRYRKPAEKYYLSHACSGSIMADWG